MVLHLWYLLLLRAFIGQTMNFTISMPPDDQGKPLRRLAPMLSKQLEKPRTPPTVPPVPPFPPEELKTPTLSKTAAVETKDVYT